MKYFFVAFLLTLLVAWLFGCHQEKPPRCITFVGPERRCTQWDPPNAATPLPSQSWDQENLKRNDSGCPTSIYIAPGGNLQLCPATF
jgi:hypothetical protein